jgi:hypothetical protein
MGADPAIRNVYPPAYHALGGLLAPWIGLAAYAELFAWAGAAALIFAFRVFQRAAGLPDACSALFAWSPYLFALTACLPKIEEAGYAIALLGLAALLKRRHAAAALCVLAAFWVHTAAALFLGLVGGVIALARSEGPDRRGLAALALGALAALPLLAWHVAEGCSWAQALLFSRDDYLRAAPRAQEWSRWLRVALLANPLALGAAAAGVASLRARPRELLFACATIVLLYLNELWLAPFGARTTLDVVRGLTVLAIPTAVYAGLAVARSPRWATGLAGASAALAIATTLFVVPDTCVSKPVDVAGAARFDVDRCTFRWRPRAQPPEGLAPRQP